MKGSRPLSIMSSQIQFLCSSGAKLPSRESSESAGYDISCISDGVIEPGVQCLVDTGLRWSAPPGYVMILKGRSGIEKRGIYVHAGVIDSDYRGPIKVMMKNDSDKIFEMKPGDRIAQGIILRLPEINVVQVESLDDTIRGEGGFGSTGR